MLADIELLILPPYRLNRQRTLIHILVKEFASNEWNQFCGAIAFAKQSGNSKSLIDAMRKFCEHGGRLEITFGAEIFGADASGSDYAAVHALLRTLDEYPNFCMYLYSNNRNKNRTFHPKLYLFSNEDKKKALLIVGSSNWSWGGFVNNVEANILVRFDLKKRQHATTVAEIRKHFSTYWRDLSEP